ncbi:hypothetical protein M758_2G239700 [Ceratodon purpureus]|nr:hypothetical protein M758_2G239700 [Ceratodon purpureus]
MARHRDWRRTIHDNGQGLRHYTPKVEMNWNWNWQDRKTVRFRRPCCSSACCIYVMLGKHSSLHQLSLQQLRCIGLDVLSTSCALPLRSSIDQLNHLLDDICFRLN